MVLGESLGLLLIGYWLSLCLARLHTECTVKMRWHQHISSRARKLRSAETSLRTCLRLKRGEVSEAKRVDTTCVDYGSWHLCFPSDAYMVTNIASASVDLERVSFGGLVASRRSAEGLLVLRLCYVGSELWRLVG